MTKLYIAEYVNVVADAIPVVPPIITQAVTYTASGAEESAAFQDTTNYVEVVADTDVSLDWGASPIATTDSPFLLKGDRKLVRVQNGAGHKVSVVYNPA